VSWLVTLALLALAGEINLIANGGFEELSGDRPARWDVFVAPYPAQADDDVEPPAARSSQEAAEGNYAVMLHNPQAYPSEPYNNWSQNVVGDYGGKTLTLTGHVRTEDAEAGAGLWVQCWRKNPLRVVAIANTATGYPLYGTTPWTPVEAELTVPEGTELLTVRCVLKGSGKAWFDEIALHESGEDRVVLSESEPEEMDAGRRDEETPAAERTDDVEAELARLREANLMLAEALEAVRQDNRLLLEDLLSLRESMRQLQEALAESDSAGALLPPLVPRDFEEPPAP